MGVTDLAVLSRKAWSSEGSRTISTVYSDTKRGGSAIQPISEEGRKMFWSADEPWFFN